MKICLFIPALCAQEGFISKGSQYLSYGVLLLLGQCCGELDLYANNKVAFLCGLF